MAVNGFFGDINESYAPGLKDLDMDEDKYLYLKREVYLYVRRYLIFRSSFCFYEYTNLLLNAARCDKAQKESALRYLESFSFSSEMCNITGNFAGDSFSVQNLAYLLGSTPVANAEYLEDSRNRCMLFEVREECRIRPSDYVFRLIHEWQSILDEALFDVNNRQPHVYSLMKKNINFIAISTLAVDASGNVSDYIYKKGFIRDIAAKDFGDAVADTSYEGI